MKFYHSKTPCKRCGSHQRYPKEIFRCVSCSRSAAQARKREYREATAYEPEKLAPENIAMASVQYENVEVAWV